MKHFLMVFDRPRGQLLAMEEFADSRNALRARFQAERKYRSYPDVEVVVLGAESEAALHRTHARYFERASDLVHSLGQARLTAA